MGGLRMGIPGQHNGGDHSRDLGLVPMRRYEGTDPLGPLARLLCVAPPRPLEPNDRTLGAQIESIGVPPRVHPWMGKATSWRFRTNPSS